MARVHKSVLVPYSAGQMFERVDRFEDYPQFLPWCSGATVLARTPEETLAPIDSNYYGVRAHFTTANRHEPLERIVIEQRDGPFRRLDGSWRFRALAAAACKVEFELSYEFSTSIMQLLIGPVFKHVTPTFVDGFGRRATAAYGP